MARTTTRRTTSKKRAVRKKRNTTTLWSRIPVGRIAYFAALFFLLVFSVGMLGYVVFFRTVVAAELPFKEKDIVFEEPYDAVPETKQSTPELVTSTVELAKVALIIDDMGFHRETGRRLIDLDLELSFSFLPYAPHTPELEEKSYQKGREILLHMPMEARSPEWNPGPDALYLSDDRKTHERLFEKNLALVPHATGVSSHMGSRYSENRAAMNELADILKKRGLFFIDSFTSSDSKGLLAARENGVPSARRHVFLDNVQKQQAICDQLHKLVVLAQRQGNAIGIGHPYPETLKALQHCGPAILSGVELVAAGTLVE